MQAAFEPFNNGFSEAQSMSRLRGISAKRGPWTLGSADSSAVRYTIAKIDAATRDSPRNSVERFQIVMNESLMMSSTALVCATTPDKNRATGP